MDWNVLEILSYKVAMLLVQYKTELAGLAVYS